MEKYRRRFVSQLSVAVKMSEESIVIELNVVPKWKKIVFGLGNLGYGVQSAILLFFQTAFLLEVARIPPV
jgi:hypothetical protein